MPKVNYTQARKHARRVRTHLLAAQGEVTDMRKVDPESPALMTIDSVLDSLIRKNDRYIADIKVRKGRSDRMKR